MGLEMYIRYTDVLRDGTLKNDYVNGKPCGYGFDVRLGYYRGHYLSDIDELAVTVDGQAVDEEDIFFCVNGKEFAPAELKYQIAEFWQIKQPARIRVHRAGGLAPGEHEVDLRLMLHSPYMPLPGATEPHTYTPINSCDRKTMMLVNDGRV